MNQKVISCRVASAVVALEVIFLGKNHSNREAQCLVRKDMGPWTILIAVATPVPASQHKQTNNKSELRTAKIDPYFEKKIIFGGVAKTWEVTILTLEQNPPERMFEMNINNSLERILLWSQNCNTALFLLATRALPASPNFGQAKHGQNDPAATVCQQCICCPICGHHFTHWTHPDISLRFRAGGRRVKNFRFLRIFISLW